MKFTLYAATCRGRERNKNYPNRVEVTDIASLVRAISYDYVGAEYKDSHRAIENFIESDCLLMDIDNSHSNDPEAWIEPEDLEKILPGVEYAIHYSRHHMLFKPSDGRGPRPRFHVFFPIEKCSDHVAYAALKQELCDRFEFFDSGAKDAARFLYGTENPQAAIFDGWRYVDEFLRDETALPKDDEGLAAFIRYAQEHSNEPVPDVIPQGSRNKTVFAHGLRIYTRYGDCDQARELFDDLADRCQPALPQREVETIRDQVRKYYLTRIKVNPNYIPPEQFGQICPLKPLDYSDTGEAMILKQECRKKLRYSEATSYLVYNGSFWQESVPLAQLAVQRLTERQLAEAEARAEFLKTKLIDSGMDERIIFSPAARGKKAMGGLNEEQLKWLEEYSGALAYQKFVLTRRNSSGIENTLKEARPHVLITPSQLDADPFALNTPIGTVDLKTGDIRRHNSADLLTRQTAYAPSDENAEIWLKALGTFFCGDFALIRYVQEVIGLTIIGKVHSEGIIIAYGSGRNGKSTFFNTIMRALGSYSGGISADTLTVGCKRNVKPEIAELRGKRLIIAAELEEGQRLNTSTVKQLSSTDDIQAEKKYKDPFAFKPTFKIILYTNHLPRVGALDEGTWRRLTVIPFNAVIEGDSDIKNFTDYLLEKCGGAILQWCIDGAKRVIENDFHLREPEVVRKANEDYRNSNNWLTQFVEEYCVTETGTEISAMELYKSYVEASRATQTYTHRTADFFNALEGAGYEKYKSSDRRIMFKGLRLKTAAERAFEDKDKDENEDKPYGYYYKMQ